MKLKALLEVIQEIGEPEDEVIIELMCDENVEWVIESIPTYQIEVSRINGKTYLGGYFGEPKENNE